MNCPGCDCDPIGYAPHNGKGDLCSELLAQKLISEAIDLGESAITRSKLARDAEVSLNSSVDDLIVAVKRLIEVVDSAKRLRKGF